MPDIEKTPLIKTWLDRKGLQLLEMLTQAQKEKYKTSKGLFKTLNDKFKPQYNETIKSLQFHKLSRKADKSAEECMGKLRIAATECNCKEINRQLQVQFMYGLNDSDMYRNNKRTHKNRRKQYCDRWASPGVGKKSWGTKGTISHPRKLKWNKRLWQNIHKKHSVKVKWDATARTDQNAHENEMQVLLFHSSAQIMPSVWIPCATCGKINHFKEVCRSGRSKKLHSIDDMLW